MAATHPTPGSLTANARLRRAHSVLDDEVKAAIEEGSEATWTTAFAAALDHVTGGSDDVKPGIVTKHALGFASRMVNAGYTMRGHPCEQRLSTLMFNIITSAEWFTKEAPDHRWACSIFAGHAASDRGEMWHYSSPVGRVPVVPYRPLRDFIDKFLVAPRSALSVNSGFSHRRSKLLGCIRSVALEARALYPPEAFAEVWEDLKNWLDVHTHFGWPGINLYLPTNRLFGADPLFPCSDAQFEQQLAVCREIVGSAMGTAHWSSSSGTPNWGMLRVLRRIWVSYLQANPEDPARQAKLDAVFDRQLVVPFVFHIAFLALRIPIATPEEHQRQANVEDDKLYIGESKCSVRSEAADCLAAFAPTKDDDVFWPLFEQLCRIAEVHANPSSTRRSSYAVAFLANFCERVARRVKGEITPEARVHPKHRLPHATLARIAALTRPLAARAAFGSHGVYAEAIFSASCFFEPTPAVADEILTMVKLGLGASHESHQIARSVNVFTRVLGNLWGARLARCKGFDKGTLTELPTPAAAQEAIIAALPELLPQLLLGLDPNDLSKVTPCSMALFRIMACCATTRVKCTEEVLGMTPSDAGRQLVERVGAVINAFPKENKSMRKAMRQTAASLAGCSGVILERLVEAGATESIIAAVDKELASVTADSVPLFNGLVLAVVSGGGPVVVAELLSRFLKRSDPSSNRETAAMEQTQLTVTLIAASPSEVVREALPRIQALVASWKEHTTTKEGRGRSWLRCTQMQGKLARATIQALLSSKVTLDDGYDTVDSVFPGVENVPLRAAQAAPEAVEAARDWLAELMKGPREVLESFAADSADRHASVPASVLQALQMLRYLLCGAARRLFRQPEAMAPRAPRFDVVQSDFVWTPDAPDDSRDECWFRAWPLALPTSCNSPNPLPTSIADEGRLVLRAADRVADIAEQAGPISAHTVKATKVIMKVVAVVVGRKSTIPMKLESMCSDLANSLADSALATDGYHHPRPYFVAKAMQLRFGRLYNARPPADECHLGLLKSALRFTGRCSVIGNHIIRAAAQDQFSLLIDRAVEMTDGLLARSVLLDRTEPLLDDPSAYVKRPDHEITGLFWAAHDVLRLLWNDKVLLKRGLGIAAMLIRAPQFSKPANEDRRGRFFSTLRAALYASSGSEFALAAVRESIGPIAAEQGAANITLERFFTVIDATVPDADTHRCNEAQRKASAAADDDAATVAADTAAPSALRQLLDDLPFVLHHAADLSATTTDAPQVLLVSLLLAAPRRRSKVFPVERFDAKGRVVDDDGTTYLAAPGHRKVRIFPSREEKAHEVDPAGKVDGATLATVDAEAEELGTVLWRTMTQQDPDDASRLVPSPWLVEFFELAVSTQPESFSAHHAQIWRAVMHAASAAPELGHGRLEATRLIYRLCIDNIMAAVAGEQVREQVHRCCAALNAIFGVYRGAKTIPEGAPERQYLLEPLCELMRLACAQVNVPQEVLDCIEEGIVSTIKAIPSSEVAVIADLLAGIALEVDDGTSQCCVRAISLLASLGLLGLNGDQYPPILRAMGRVIGIVHRCNHQMRHALIALVYRFFYVVGFLDPDWLVAGVARPLLAGAACPDGRVVNIDSAAVTEMLELRTQVWESLAAPLRKVPASDNGHDVTADKETLNVAKVFAASLSGSQSVVTTSNEAEAAGLLFKIAGLAVTDGDDLRDLVGDAVWSFAFQRHTAAGSLALTRAALDVLNDPKANKRAKVHAALLGRIVGYLNQFQWPSQAAHEAYGKSLIMACVANFDNTHRPLRNEVTASFAVFCRVLRRDVIKAFAARFNKIVTGKAPEDNTVSMSAAIVASCVIATSFPESVPEFMPRLLMRLAKWSALLPAAFGSAANHADSMTTVKETLRTWWKTHRDEWHYRHKDAFTTEQQETLMDHFQGQTYYV